MYCVVLYCMLVLYIFIVQDKNNGLLDGSNLTRSGHGLVFLKGTKRWLAYGIGIN